MEDIGNLALYVILAIIAIAGSIQSSKKKKAAETGCAKGTRYCAGDDGAFPADATTEQASVCASSGTCQ